MDSVYAWPRVVKNTRSQFQVWALHWAGNKCKLTAVWHWLEVKKAHTLEEQISQNLPFLVSARIGSRFHICELFSSKNPCSPQDMSRLGAS